MALEQRYNLSVATLVDVHFAPEKARVRDVADAISQSRTAVNGFSETGDKLWAGYSTNVLVEALLQRGTEADLLDAQAAVDRLAGLPMEPGVVVHQDLAAEDAHTSGSGSR